MITFIILFLVLLTTRNLLVTILIALLLTLCGCATQKEFVDRPVEVKVAVPVPCAATESELLKNPYDFYALNSITSDADYASIVKAYLITVYDLKSENEQLRNLLNSCNPSNN